MKITREKFIEATGREPENDDLERCNCPLAGKVGHWACGWDDKANLPVFDVLPIANLHTSQRISADVLDSRLEI